MTSISVITINYNNKAGLKKTIDSVLSQDLTGIEFIVVDGGSSDGSAELVRSYGVKIQGFVSEKDTGIYNAQNKGIAMASGEYLLFLNSGDFLCDDKVMSRVLPHLGSADIVYGNMRINWGRGSISHGTMPDSISTEHMIKDTLWHPVSFIRRSLFDTYGKYDESLRLVADYDFFFKVLIKHKVSSLHIPVEICEFSADGASSQAKNKKAEQQERRIVQERYLDSSELGKFANLRVPARRHWFHRISNWFR